MRWTFIYFYLFDLFIWTCTKAKKYWSMVRELTQNIFQIPNIVKPEFFLLNIVQNNLCKYSRHILINAVTAARILYARFWKLEDTPQKSDLLRVILQLAEMDILSERLKENTDYRVIKTWGEVHNWFKQNYK